MGPNSKHTLSKGNKLFKNIQTLELDGEKKTTSNKLILSNSAYIHNLPMLELWSEALKPNLTFQTLWLDDKRTNASTCLSMGLFCSFDLVGHVNTTSSMDNISTRPWSTSQ